MRACLHVYLDERGTKEKSETHKCSFSCRDSPARASVALPACLPACVRVCVGGRLLAFTFSGVQQVQRAVRC